MGNALVKVSYVNVSGSDIPPHGMLQLTGSPVVTGTGDYVLQATYPGGGNGPYMIDDGKGASASGDGRYGSCSRAVDGLCWVAYGCGGGPPIPWEPVGPVLGSFYVNEYGTGYSYAGVFDAENNRILVLMNTFTAAASICTATSGSSSSGSASNSNSGSSGDGSSGSGSSSGDDGCITVVTSVTCDRTGLHVTYGRAKKCDT